MSDFHLISFDLCPFVQRSVIVLHEKGVPFETTYIDLADKPAWFQEISPMGKVPLLKVDGSVLFESAVICEYLDEVTEGSLLPDDALERAKDRAVISMAGELNVAGYRIMVAGDEQAARQAAQAAHDVLARLEPQIVGPLWHGESLGLVDAGIAPGLQRLHWVEEIVDLGIFAGLPKCRSWCDALLARDSVKRSLVPDIHATWVSYLKGGGSPSRKAAPAWLASQL